MCTCVWEQNGTVILQLCDGCVATGKVKMSGWLSYALLIHLLSSVVVDRAIYLDFSENPFPVLLHMLYWYNIDFDF